MLLGLRDGDDLGVPRRVALAHRAVAGFAKNFPVAGHHAAERKLALRRTKPRELDAARHHPAIDGIERRIAGCVHLSFSLLVPCRLALASSAAGCSSNLVCPAHTCHSGVVKVQFGTHRRATKPTKAAVDATAKPNITSTIGSAVVASVSKWLTI